MYVSVPSGESAGGTRNSPGLSVATTNDAVCPDSLDGPQAILDAKPGSFCAPRGESTTRLPPSEKLGASFTGSTVIVNVAAALVSTPPPAVPPSSVAVTATTATPNASAAGVYVRVPSTATVGWTTKRPGLSVDTMKRTLCPVSESGPGEIELAHLTDCAPASSRTV